MTVYAPVARDLRVLLVTVRITSELERIGDQAVDNCEYADLRSDNRRGAERLSAMSEIVFDMLRRAPEAFAQEASTNALAVMHADDRVDELYAQLFRDMVDTAKTDMAGTSHTGLVLLGRSLERIADHATNICEEVFYMVEGADIRHQACQFTSDSDGRGYSTLCLVNDRRRRASVKQARQTNSGRCGMFRPPRKCRMG